MKKCDIMIMKWILEIPIRNWNEKVKNAEIEKEDDIRDTYKELKPFGNMAEDINEFANIRDTYKELKRGKSKEEDSTQVY